MNKKVWILFGIVAISAIVVSSAFTVNSPYLYCDSNSSNCDLNSTIYFNQSTLSNYAAVHNCFDITNRMAVVATGATPGDYLCSNALRITSGQLGTNQIIANSDWATLGTLRIGDGGDRIDINTSGYKIQNNLMTGINLTAGKIIISSLNGSGNAYACLDSNGQLYRSTTVCV